MERRQHHDVQHNEIALKLLPCLPGEKMKYNKQEKSDWLYDPSVAARTVTHEEVIEELTDWHRKCYRSYI